MAAPSNKRKRTLSGPPENENTSTEGSDTSAIRPSEDLYLDDGNIVLVAENTAFRVHRSQLARHSEVFRNMLEIPSQPLDGELFDGCPVTRVSDKVEDMSRLLRVLYNHVTLDWTVPEQLVSICRLSTKYLLDDIRPCALTPLLAMYPSLLSEWDAYTHIRVIPDKVIILASETGEDRHLPAAYYVLCGYDLSVVLSLNLPRQVLETYILGKDRLARRHSGTVNRILDRSHVSIGKGPSGSESCSNAWDSLRAILKSPDSIFNPQPLSNFHLLTGSESPSSHMCLRCQQYIQGVVELARKNTWLYLPQAFNLGTWDVLLRDP